MDQPPKKRIKFGSVLPAPSSVVSGQGAEKIIEELTAYLSEPAWVPEDDEEDDLFTTGNQILIASNCFARS